MRKRDGDLQRVYRHLAFIIEMVLGSEEANTTTYLHLQSEYSVPAFVDEIVCAIVVRNQWVVRLNCVMLGIRVLCISMGYYECEFFMVVIYLAWLSVRLSSIILYLKNRGRQLKFHVRYIFVGALQKNTLLVEVVINLFGDKYICEP